MFSRRTFLSLVAGGMAAPGLASAQPTSQKVALYANVGADLTHYDVDVTGAELIKRETVTLPAAVQYAWPHASRRYLYVASSSSAPGYGTQGTEHHVTALAIDPSTGALTVEYSTLRRAVSTAAFAASTCATALRSAATRASYCSRARAPLATSCSPRFRLAIASASVAFALARLATACK